MDKKEIRRIKDLFIKGQTNELRFNKLTKDISEIASYKIIPTPFGNYDKVYTLEQFNNDVHLFNRIKYIIEEKNLYTEINTNDYCLYSHKDKNFANAINIVINRLRNNCNYIIITNEYIKKDIKCLINFGLLASTNLSNIFVINHNFIFRGDSSVVDYIYTLFHSNVIYATDKKSYIYIGNYLDDEKINLSKNYYNKDIERNIYNKFLIHNEDNTEYRNKVADAYIKYYDINLINPKVDFTI